MFIGGLEAWDTGHCLKELKNESVQSYVFSPIVHSAGQLFSVHLNGETGPSDFLTTLVNDLYLDL